ncbi:hypothetical protein [Streptomyces ehimensis]|uniref:Uncharacterized protein n=1 Tax=Streptomyces ehimensis TaxID=68195 RepID=A0ABV9BEZ1_9ACTN
MKHYLRQHRHGDVNAVYRPYGKQGADLDEVAVDRLVAGDPPASVTRPERAAAVRRLHGQGLTDSQIAARLGVERVVAWRVRTRMGLPINRERTRSETEAGAPAYLLPHPWISESVIAAHRRTARQNGSAA